ncbi:hypothetical protein M408DRAFT_90037 [Serendipita vermifera MAFF 305830]|uniref:Uncharacterized protein n=1 Tax=Serendipita vermifera MAFF 305830 TaxID=933852 RepID=A0A0C2XYY2_SERVB|nr:hypothetical protein M408DRAFT_90037 [Serendipita vermifera MAFF 305830]
MNILSTPPIRSTRHKIASYLFQTAQCTRFYSPLAFLPASKSMTNIQLRQAHPRHPITHPTPTFQRLKRLNTLFIHGNRSAWSLAFMRPLWWRKPPEDDEAARQREEEAARSAILEKAFESRQPADLMLRCTILDEAGMSVVSSQSHLDVRIIPTRRHRRPYKDHLGEL